MALGKFQGKVIINLILCDNSLAFLISKKIQPKDCNFQVTFM